MWNSDHKLLRLLVKEKQVVCEGVPLSNQPALEISLINTPRFSNLNQASGANSTVIMGWIMHVMSPLRLEYKKKKGRKAVKSSSKQRDAKV